MEKVITGKVSLYARNVSTFQSTFIGSANMTGSGYYYDDFQYYLKREDEQVAKLIVGPNSFGSFTSKAKEYFSDCEKMVYYLDNELYSQNNLIELVDDYNLLCE